MEGGIKAVWEGFSHLWKTVKKETDIAKRDLHSGLEVEKQDKIMPHYVRAWGKRKKGALIYTHTFSRMSSYIVTKREKWINADQSENIWYTKLQTAQFTPSHCQHSRIQKDRIIRKTIPNVQ